MKPLHLILLLFIAASMAVLVSYSGNLTTYDTIASATQKKGQFVHLITSLVKDSAVLYDPVYNPNYLSFYVRDTAGHITKVVYADAKPVDLEKSVQIVIKGRMREQYFDCKEILLKCPSKYKDDAERLQEQIRNVSEDL